MLVFICSYCGSERKSKKSLIGHETFCKENPDHKLVDIKSAREKALSLKIKCEWCELEFNKSNIKKHERSCRKNPEFIKNNIKNCPVCNKPFFGKSETCSYSCSNTHFRHSRIGGLRYVEDDELLETNKYRSICFRFHNKKCIICEEENIIAVHHMNGNHNDNSPENLIPLCPTHHQYCHSRFKYIIEPAIVNYIENWKRNNRNLAW